MKPHWTILPCTSTIERGEVARGKNGSDGGGLGLQGHGGSQEGSWVVIIMVVGSGMVSGRSGYCSAELTEEEDGGEHLGLEEKGGILA